MAALVIAVADYAYLNRRFGLHASLSFYLRILLATGLMYGAVRSLPAMGFVIEANWMSIAIAVAIGAAVCGLLIAAMFPRFIRMVLRRSSP